MAVVVDNATHGHGDHFFGASVLLDRFPKARFVAAPSAIQVMKEQIYRSLWRSSAESRFPNQLPKGLVVAQEVRTNAIELEGENSGTCVLDGDCSDGPSDLPLMLAPIIDRAPDIAVGARFSGKSNPVRYRGTNRSAIAWRLA